MPQDTGYFYCNELPTMPQPEIGKILVTGATGYIGGRLVPELLARGYNVRVMVKAASSEHRERWPNAEIATANALEFESLKKVLQGVHTAYYLIHSLLLGETEFESADIQAAINFKKAAEEQDVKRIIYLGGLGDTKSPLSPHLKSRMQVAKELEGGKVPTTILRAAVIIGSGSASYEIIKSLIENAPILLIPKWALTKCQPISVRDVVKYLVGVLEVDDTSGQSFDIGGEDILTYEKMLKILADFLGKKRLFIPFPVTNVGFYSYIVNLLTPVPSPITRCLLEGTRNEVICQNDNIKDFLPFQTLSYKEAILKAMSREEQDTIYTRWSDSYPPAHDLALKMNELKDTDIYKSSYTLLTEKNPSSLFHSITRIGGKKGWFYSNWLWRLRGTLDRILIGVGTSRGRRSSSSLRINDVIDFWRVEDLKQNEMLLLRAEMKLPGRAWLKFSIEKEEKENRLSVTAYYQTESFLGKLYWYICLPLHLFIFYNLIKQIEKRS